MLEAPGRHEAPENFATVKAGTRLVFIGFLEYVHAARCHVASRYSLL
jgi:hypothetical protein